jgi:hypothetical protein
MKTAAMTTMMAGPKTVGLGCFSPVQRLDERSKASRHKIVLEHFRSLEAAAHNIILIILD